MTGTPERGEAAPYYFKYIDRVPAGDIRVTLETQLGDALAFFSGIAAERSLHRYEPGKWSIRQVLNHVSDCERLFVSRAFWFARGFDTPLPSFEQEVAAAAARADDCSWPALVEEFRSIRSSTVTFFRNLPREAWQRRGTASGNPVTVKALAFIAAGHLLHHEAILRERYL